MVVVAVTAVVAVVVAKQVIITPAIHICCPTWQGSGRHSQPVWQPRSSMRYPQVHIRLQSMTGQTKR